MRNPEKFAKTMATALSPSQNTAKNSYTFQIRLYFQQFKIFRLTSFFKREIIQKKILVLT